MRSLDELSITTAVLQGLSNTRNERLKLVMTALIGHLHDFTREVRLTPDEWLEAIKFLTSTGQICTDRRQEFILLSDTLGLSTLVNALQSRTEDATPSTVLGPFYRDDAPFLAMGASISTKQFSPLLVHGHISDAGGRPIEGAEFDVWQASDDGFYDIQREDPREIDLRGHFRTGRDGCYEFYTERPGGYPIPNDGPVGKMLAALGRHPNRPAHIHFLIKAEGYENLATALYLSDSPYIGDDAVFGDDGALAVSVSPPATATKGPPSIAYDFVLASTMSAVERRGVGADASKLRERGKRSG